MDGVKKRLKHTSSDSLQVRLSVWLTLVILGVAVVAGVFSFYSAFDEAHELQDDVLRQVAALFDQQHLPVPHLGDKGRLVGSNEESRVIVQYLSNNPIGKRDTVDVDNTPPLTLSATLADGMQTLNVENEPYRILVKTLTSGARIAVAQETGIRDEIARDSALRTLMPFLILVPILLLVVADLVRKLFRPIALLSAEIDQRSEIELHSFTTESIRTIPAEVRPFIVAINRLLHRVSQSVDAQRRFVADAAHELRSPLTALSLQAERLAEADMSDSARERLKTLRHGIERGRNLLEQLLTLARVQSASEVPTKAVSVRQIYRRVLEDLMPLAEAKKIDIGLLTECDAQVVVNELDLTTLIKNLVDNAIRYSPHGGKVDLAINTSEHMTVLRVTDSGPGIPSEMRDRVFDPFYRVLGNEETGSGLGLSIVQTIVHRIGARVCLEYADETRQTGLNARVFIPIVANPVEPGSAWSASQSDL